MNLPVVQTSAGVHRTKIGWCDYSVGGPIRFRRKDTGKAINACVKVSPGCQACYAESIGLHWGTGLPYTAAAMEQLEPFLDAAVLSHMLRFRPRGPYRRGGDRPLVFLGDMTDLFGDWVETGWLDTIFAACALRHDVDWLMLTKRERRLDRYMNSPGMLRPFSIYDQAYRLAKDGVATDDVRLAYQAWHKRWHDHPESRCLPPANVWVGMSTERQTEADRRCPRLLRVPAAVRYLSAEPLLGPIDLVNGAECAVYQQCVSDKRTHDREHAGGFFCDERSLDWVIIGVMSNGARVGNLGEFKTEAHWIEAAADIALQCREAGVPLFVKQIPRNGRVEHVPTDDWPEPLRVQQWPKQRAA